MFNWKTLILGVIFGCLLCGLGLYLMMIIDQGCNMARMPCNNTISLGGSKMGILNQIDQWIEIKATLRDGVIGKQIGKQIAKKFNRKEHSITKKYDKLWRCL